MPVPKKRLSRTRRDRRRAQHDKAPMPSMVRCSACGEYKLPHHVCGACGWYKDRYVLEIEEASAEAAE